MISRWVGAITYKLKVSDILSENALTLHISSCSGADLGVTPLRSERWYCKMPEPGKSHPRRPGYSETMGMVGGIANPVVAARSEVIERVVGDALTVSLVQMAEDQAEIIYVKGPCFPKVLGRFLSLRLPAGITIAWLTQLHREGDVYGYNCVVSSTRKLFLDHDDLLNGFTFPDKDPRWLVEFVDTGDRSAKAALIRDSLEHVTMDLPRVMRFSEGIYLPIGEKNFVKSARLHVPAWLFSNLPSVVKSTAVAAKGPTMFEWAEPE